jgi:hypothetical protein
MKTNTVLTPYQVRFGWQLALKPRNYISSVFAESGAGVYLRSIGIGEASIERRGRMNASRSSVQFRSRQASIARTKMNDIGKVTLDNLLKMVLLHVALIALALLIWNPTVLAANWTSFPLSNGEMTS